jgi:hypothetical protein
MSISRTRGYIKHHLWDCFSGNPCAARGSRLPSALPNSRFFTLLSVQRLLNLCFLLFVLLVLFYISAAHEGWKFLEIYPHRGWWGVGGMVGPLQTGPTAHTAAGAGAIGRPTPAVCRGAPHGRRCSEGHRFPCRTPPTYSPAPLRAGRPTALAADGRVTAIAQTTGRGSFLFRRPIPVPPHRLPEGTCPRPLCTPRRGVAAPPGATKHKTPGRCERPEVLDGFPISILRVPG